MAAMHRGKLGTMNKQKKFITITFNSIGVNNIVHLIFKKIVIELIWQIITMN